MAEITISKQDWEKVKIKFRRKYRELTDEDVSFEPGQEEKLISTLMAKVNRNREYVVFTIKKGLADMGGNRL